jgi:2-aminobenzoate-CoA ligase
MTLSPSAYADTFARDSLPPVDQWPTLEFTGELLQYPDRLNAASEIIDVAVATFGSDRPALRTAAGDLWTYGELQHRANLVARVLVEDLGLVPGNRVLLRSPNNPWTVAAWLGILKAGGIAVTTMAALRPRELTPIVEKTKPTIALVDHRYIDDVVTMKELSRFDLSIVTYGGPAPDDLTKRILAKPAGFTPVQTAADDVALLGPTSGSTGTPKITMHFHRDLLSIDNTFGKQVLALRPDDVVSTTAPYAFTFGLGMLVFTLRAGACAFLTETATPAQLADLVTEHGITVLATAPTAYKQILKIGKGRQLSSLRAAVSAGEHLPERIWQAYEHDLGLKIIDGIGATELLHIFISAAGADIRPGATGKPVPGFRATILDDQGEEVPAGVEGRLAVIGPVGCRYLGDDRQAGYVVNGWNVTGDTFSRDKDGYFWYRARTDNMIVSSGYNIGGPEVEAAIDAHPDVVETGVIGVPDPDRGAIVCAFVVLRDGVAGDEAKAKEIQGFVKNELAPYKYPRAVHFVAALPRNTSGKLQRYLLRKMIEDAP